jgi:regulator of ribonuclease activity A
MINEPDPWINLAVTKKSPALVVDDGSSRRCALLGDRLAAMAVESGWAGVVVNGCIRDSAVIAHIDLGVLALGTQPRKSEKHGAGRRDVPVIFSGVTFRPGAYLYADPDGVLISDRPLL